MKTKYSIAFFSALMLLASCEDFLDRQPLDFLAPENYYTDERTVNNGILGIYDALQADALYGQQLLYQFATNSDIETFNRDINGSNGRTTQMLVCAHTPDNTELYSTWTALYEGIGRANTMISVIPGVEALSDDQKTDFTAEARGLRGLFYLNLAAYWNNVPIRKQPVTSPSDIHLAASPVEEVYALVLEDLEFAAEHLPSPKTIKAAKLGRMTNTAAMALLARTNLYMAGFPLKQTERYEEVVKWCKALMAEGYHELNPSFAQIFTNHSQDIYEPKECIMEVFFSGTINSSSNETGRIGTFNGIKSEYVDGGYSYGFFYVNPYLFGLYSKTDNKDNPGPYTNYNANKEFNQTNYTALKDSRACRVTANFFYAANGNISYYSASDARKYPGKWRRSEELEATRGDKNYNSTNCPVVRYADILLMLAEAYNAMDGTRNAEAEWAVNQVRRRAFKQPLGATSAYDMPAGLGKEAFLTYIQDERGRELCFEGLRRLDLIRWEMYVEHIKTVVQTFKNFEQRNDNTLANEQIGRCAQIYDYIQPKHVVCPIPQRELGINNLLEQHPLWK